MHSEYIDVDLEAIANIMAATGSIAAVGTTSLRTLETLYWFGVKVAINPMLNQLDLKQWDVYQEPLSTSQISAKAALQALLNWMELQNIQRIFTQTQLLIAPGYRFRIANMLVTNFHQPKSTLLLLVAAAVGDQWKNLYQYALEHEYRFLSYGDGNLIFIDPAAQEH
jgi:S-adenosylmethionine:tRNA ribosyltransferase-isomerase